MKHRILIEFESDHLPDDFTDQVAGRVYMMPCVKKVECTATLVTALAAPAIERTVDVFYLEHHDPFICGVHGKFSLFALSEIERDIHENPDFQKGSGTYSYSVTRFEGQYGFEGRCELSPGWELCETVYTPIEGINPIQPKGSH